MVLRALVFRLGLCGVSAGPEAVAFDGVGGVGGDGFDALPAGVEHVGDRVVLRGDFAGPEDRLRAAIALLERLW